MARMSFLEGFLALAEDFDLEDPDFSLEEEAELTDLGALGALRAFEAEGAERLTLAVIVLLGKLETAVLQKILNRAVLELN
jgi:hypothetical protein